MARVRTGTPATRIAEGEIDRAVTGLQSRFDGNALRRTAAIGQQRSFDIVTQIADNLGCRVGFRSFSQPTRYFQNMFS